MSTAWPARRNWKLNSYCSQLHAYLFKGIWIHSNMFAAVGWKSRCKLCFSVPLGSTSQFMEIIKESAAMDRRDPHIQYYFSFFSPQCCNFLQFWPADTCKPTSKRNNRCRWMQTSAAVTFLSLLCVFCKVKDALVTADTWMHEHGCTSFAQMKYICVHIYFPGIFFLA